LKSIGQREQQILLAVAPHAGVAFNADQFIEDLSGLADASPVEVCEVLDEMLKVYKPDYDFENRLVNLLRKLASQESTRINAIRMAERLVGQLPDMVEFYQEITSSHSTVQT
jgi:hypothetical protein